MRILRLSDSKQPPSLVEADIPRPQPRPGELLVRVHAAGVTSKELLWYPTTHEKNGIGASHQTGWTGLVAKLLQQSGE